MLHFMKPQMSKISTPLRVFAQSGFFFFFAATAFAQAPLCHSIFRTEPSAKFTSEITGRLDPKDYEAILLQVDQALRLLEPIPADYTVVLKAPYGQGSKNIFGSRRAEFTEVHTTYQNFTGKEDLTIVFPILAHEYSHAYFEATMRKLSAEWDRNSNFLDYPFADAMVKKDYESVIKIYHEFFADLVPSVLFKNPAAMQSAMRFHEGAKNPNSVLLRKFEGYKTEEHEVILKDFFKQGSGATAYLYLVPLRNNIWPVIQNKLSAHPEKTDQVFKSIVVTLAKDYEVRIKTNNFNFSKMNTELTQSLSESINNIP